MNKVDKVFSANKDATKQNISALKKELDELLKKDNQVSKDGRAKGLSMLDEHLAAAARKMVLEKEIRVDGRGLDQIRPLASEVGLLPRVHGSGLFDRGETQVLSVVTLG